MAGIASILFFGFLLLSPGTTLGQLILAQFERLPEIEFKCTIHRTIFCEWCTHSGSVGRV